jgi:SAM-dependent methyltransferase
MKYTKKDFCRCCKKKDLLLYLNLGKQPLANSYHKGEKLANIPLEVMVCGNCYHNQLSVVVNPDDMFLNYLYVSGTTETFRNHTKELAKDALSRVKHKNVSVLDIACNDGTQLEFFRELGCEVMGVDPAQNLRPITEQKNIPVIVDYWTQDIARTVEKKFDIMTGTNVFAHVDDVDEFLLASKIALKDDGFLVLEFPYADNMVAHNEFDTVYHEHLSYFLVNSVKTLMDRLGFTIVDILKTSIHGGSIRFFLQKGEGKHSETVFQLIEHEKSQGLLQEKTYIAYAERVKKNKKDMQKLIRRLRKENKKIIGYAASAKGNTMLNYFKINFNYIIDDNELKWEYLTPGRNIPIKGSATLASEKEELYIVILAWNFYNEIAKRIIKARGHKKDFAILYVPNVELRKIGDTETYRQSA